MFEVGQTYMVTDWFTGGKLKYTVYQREDNKITFDVLAIEKDGIHNFGLEEYEILKDEEKEKVIVYEYQGNVGYLYAE